MDYSDEASWTYLLNCPAFKARQLSHHTRSLAHLVSLVGFSFLWRLVYGTNTPRHDLRFRACFSFVMVRYCSYRGWP